MAPQQPEIPLDVVMATLSGEPVYRCGLSSGCSHWARKSGAPGYFYCICHWTSGAVDIEPWEFTFSCDGTRRK